MEICPSFYVAGVCLLCQRLIARKLGQNYTGTAEDPSSIIQNFKCFHETLRRSMQYQCSTNWGEKRNAYRILVGKPERKRPLGRPRRRWVDNIKMDLR
jgi:hypothetical protein